MSTEYKNTGANSQFGLINKGNTCYINTAIQTLLSMPGLPQVLAQRKALFDAVDYPPEPDADQAESLCMLLDLLLQKQYGKSVDQSVIDEVWRIFLSHYQSRMVDNTRLGTRQEDSSFAFSMFAELLKMEAPLQQQSIKHFDAVTFQGVNYAAKDISESHPCFLLPWTTNTSITTLFNEQQCEIRGVKHPDVGDKNADVVTCSEKTFICMKPEEDAFVLLPNHIPLEGRNARTFSPTQCKYTIPGEIELTIQDVKDTFVLASFSQKRGSASSGHYVAYRREGAQWYELDDNRVTTKGTQESDTSSLPTAIQSALKSERGHCARQLVYVRKSTFLAQYHKTDASATKDRLVVQSKTAERRINDALTILRKKIANIEQHHCTEEVHQATATLLNGLQIAKIQYLNNIDGLTMPILEANNLFKQKCTRLITDAKKVLANDLSWADCLTNVLKAIVNALISVVTFGHSNSFFTPTTTKSIKAVEDAEQNLKLVL